MTAPSPSLLAPVAVEDLLASIHNQLRGPFAQMELAEEEIERAAADHPADADLLYHSFSLLRATADLMSTEFVYRGHVRELLARVIAGQDTQPGTAAEACLVLSQISQRTPLNTAATGLYTRMWHQAFGDIHPTQMPGGEHYEALTGSEIDEFEAITRAKIGRREAWRQLTGITCQGRHHGEAVTCRFAASPAAGQHPAALSS